VAEAFRYMLSHKSIIVLIVVISVFSLLGTPMLRFLPILVSEVYQEEESAYGTMMALMGAGAVAGGFLLRRVPRWYPRHHLVPLTLALAGIAIAIFSMMSTALYAGAAIIIVGIAWMACFSSAFAALQLLLDDRVRGRILSICNVISFGFMPLGTLLASGMAEVAWNAHAPGLNAQRGLAMSGSLLAIVGLSLLTWRTPAIDAHAPGSIVPKRHIGLIRGITASAHRPIASRKSRGLG
jgi:predicted MFS family arabinose efflux permease